MVEKKNKKSNKPEFVFFKTKDLNFFKKNPKKFSSKQFGRLKNSVKEFDFNVPLIVNKKTKNVLDGNQRLKLAMSMNIEELPVYLVDIPEEREGLFLASINKTHMPEDPELMAEILEEYLGNALAEDLKKDYAQLERELNEVNHSEFEIVQEVNEEYNYTVFIFGKAVDYLNIETFFNLEKVYDPHKDRLIGKGRVIKGEHLLKLMELAHKQGFKNVNEIK